MQRFSVDYSFFSTNRYISKMRKSKNSDFKTPFKVPQESLPFKSVKHSVTHPAKRTKIDNSDKNSRYLKPFEKNNNLSDTEDNELPHKKPKEKNSEDKLPDSPPNKIGCISSAFLLGHSLKKFS